MADINVAADMRGYNLQGCEIEFVISATTYTVRNVVAGSMRLTPGLRAAVMYNDGGQVQTPLLGENRPSRLEFSIRAGTLHTGGLYALLTAQGTAITVGLFTSVLVRRPAVRGGAAGETITFANPWLDPDSVELQSGGENETDTITFALMAKVLPTTASY